MNFVCFHILSSKTWGDYCFAYKILFNDRDRKLHCWLKSIFNNKVSSWTKIYWTKWWQIMLVILWKSTAYTFRADDIEIHEQNISLLFNYVYELFHVYGNQRTDLTKFINFLIWFTYGTHRETFLLILNHIHHSFII